MNVQRCLRLNLVRARLRIDPGIDETTKVSNRKDLSSTGNDIKLVIRASCHLKADNGTL